MFIRKIKITMKKFILSLLLVAVGTTFMFAQNATMRLEMPDPLPTTIGETFYVGVWLDVLEYPGYAFGEPTIKSGQIGIVYDPLVLLPLQTPIPPPPPKWFHNLNQMFVDYGASPTANLNGDGDLRFVNFYGSEPGFETQYYGMPGGMKFWDLQFEYLGGNITLEFGDEDIVKKVEGQNPKTPGGILSELRTFLTAWDNEEYVMTYINYPSGGPIDYEWVGGTPGFEEDWDVETNWSPEGIPGEEDNVTFPGPVKAGPCTLSGSATVFNVTLSGGTLNIAPMGDLTSNGMFTNDGFFNILSLPTGESGSYIDNGGTGGTTGVFAFHRDVKIPTPLGAQAGWHYLSSPVSGWTSGDAISPMNDYFLNWWDETHVVNYWNHHEGAQPCVPAAPLALADVEGWSIKFDQAFAAACPAVPQTGLTIELWGPAMNMNHGGVVYSRGATVTAGSEMGWNLMGNPYPCSVDPLNITWDPGANQSLYYFDGNNGSYVSWAGGVGSLIPPTQGFFIEYTAPGFMTFDGPLAGLDERTHVPAGQWWKSDISDLLTLKAINVNNDRYDITNIRFLSEATTEWDKVWDAHKLLTEVSAVPQIYTHISGDILSINSQPATEAVPMSFVCGEAGTFTIDAIETSDFAHVVLENDLTGEQTDLLAGSYTFDYVNAGEVHPFIVHFTPLGIGDNFANSVNIWSSANNIYVKVPDVTGDIVVFNMMGQEVVRTDIDPGVNVIPMNDVNTYYVVKVLTSDNAVTGKVFIK